MSYVMPPKTFQRNIIRTSLNGIREIRPIIHRSRLFIKQCSFGEVEERLGKIRVLSPQQSVMYLKREPGYRQVGFLQRELGVLTVYFNPKEAWFPKFRFHTSQSSQVALMGLYDEFPGFPELKVSSLEYAIDFFCHSHESLNHLFYLLRRYMFFPYAHETLMRGDEFLGWNEPRKYNTVYHVDMGINHAKIYERGNDDKGLKGRSGWLHKKVNRVRLEFTFGRPFLVRKDLTDLHSLVNDAKFHQLCSPRIYFKNFKASSPFPKDWENYTATNKDGNIECLMEEFFKAKRDAQFENPMQYLEDNEVLDSLKKNILYELRKFDNDWRQAYDDNYLPQL
ncbi:MAG: hypothetical protein WC600_03990 [Desulfobaccales bacterium]